MPRFSQRRRASLLAAAAALPILRPVGLDPKAQLSPASQPVGVLYAAGDISNKCSTGGPLQVVRQTLKAVTGNRRADDATAAILRAELTDQKQRQVPARILVLGDLAYDSATDEELNCFDQSWGQFKSFLLPVPGNHEYEASNPDAAPYFRYFRGNPLVSENGPTAGYYGLNFPDPIVGPWRLIALNAYEQSNHGQHSLEAQLTWLERDLRNHPDACILAFWHPPLFSSGWHGHDGQSAVDAPPLLDDTMQKAFRLLHEYGASVIVNAHDHDLEQFDRMDADGAVVPDGLRSFVVGTGGGSLHGIDYRKRYTGSEVFATRSFGVLKIEIYADRYTWSFLAASGSPSVPMRPNADVCNRRRRRGD